MPRAPQVRIENPSQGGNPTTSIERAERFVLHRRAVVTEVDEQFRPRSIFFVNNSLNKIVARDALDQLLSQNTGYDRERRNFFKEARQIPVINADKMIREVRSARKWSFSASVFPNGHRRAYTGITAPMPTKSGAPA